MITGWVDDLKAEASEKLAQWREGLAALDVENLRLNDLREYADRDPQDAAE